MQRAMRLQRRIRRSKEDKNREMKEGNILEEE